jgi:hypothetical protein
VTNKKEALSDFLMWHERIASENIVNRFMHMDILVKSGRHCYFLAFSTSLLATFCVEGNCPKIGDASETTKFSHGK